VQIAQKDLRFIICVVAMPVALNLMFAPSNIFDTQLRVRILLRRLRPINAILLPPTLQNLPSFILHPPLHLRLLIHHLIIPHLTIHRPIRLLLHLTVLPQRHLDIIRLNLPPNPLNHFLLNYSAG